MSGVGGVSTGTGFGAFAILILVICVYQVEDGILTGEQDPPGSGNGGILMTDIPFGDFELLLDVAPDWGVDSGVFLRTNEGGECFQVYVDYHKCQQNLTS